MIRIGTRGSDLALTQTKMVARLLGRSGLATDLVVIHTSGDASDRPFRELEGKAFFTKELDEALLAGTVDLAIHSLKDLPTEDPPGLATTTVTAREDPRDVLLLRRDGADLAYDARGLPRLRAGFRLGTSSARRSSQLAAAFPGVAISDLRGNVPTRVNKLRRGDYDGILLAAAGLARLALDLSDLIVVPLDAPEFLPAPGQGVLAARYRADDDVLPGALLGLVDPQAAECARAERLVLARLDGGCSLPLGALARRRGAQLELHACLAQPDGMRRALVRAATAPEAAEAAVRALLGAPTVVVTRPTGLDDELAQAVADAGFPVARQPAIAFEALPRSAAADAAFARIPTFDLVAFTSRTAVRFFAAALAAQRIAPTALRAVAAVGDATAAELEAHGFPVMLRGDGRGADSFARELARTLPPHARILHPGPSEAEPAFAATLAASGRSVVELPLYVTRGLTADSPLPAGPLVALLASPSAARAFLERPGVRARLADARAPLTLIAGGATTAEAITRAGGRVAATARTPQTADFLATLRASIPVSASLPQTSVPEVLR